MLRFAEVKEIVRLFVRFILSFAAAVVLIVAGIVAVRWVTFHDLSATLSGRLIAVLLSDAVGPAVVPSVVVAVLSCLFRLLRFSTARPVGLLMVFALAGAALTFGMIGAGEIALAFEDTSAESIRRLETDVLYRAEPFDFYAVDRSGAELGPVVVHDSGDTPAFRMLQSVVHDAGSDVLLVSEMDTRVDLRSVRNAYWQAFVPPVGVAGVFEDARRAFSTFRAELSNGLPHLLLLSWTLALVLVSAWVVVRLSRWPLLNILLVLVLARGIFAAFSFVQTETMRDLMEIFLSPQQMHFVLPVVFTAGSVVLMLILILLPPFREWKREVARG